MHPKDKGYEYWGYYEFTANMGTNTLKSGLRGPNNIKFADGQHIRFKVPDFKLGGTVLGDRTIEATGNLFFEDLTNNRKCVIIFNTYKVSGFFSKTESGKKDEYVGLIYNCDPITDPRQTLGELYGKNAIEITELSKIKDLREQICEVEGSWLKRLVIGGKTYWNIEEHIPTRQLPAM